MYIWLTDSPIWFINRDRHLTPDWTSEFILTDFITFYSCFIYYFCFTSVYTLSSYAHSYMHVHIPLYSHTFTRSSDSLDLHIQILDILFFWSGIRGDRMIYTNSEFLPIWIWYSYLSFYSCFFCLLDLYHYRSLFCSLFIYYHVRMLICDFTVIMMHFSLFL